MNAFNKWSPRFVQEPESQFISFLQFVFVTQLRRAWWADDGESSTDVGKTRQRGEVAEERGEWDKNNQNFHYSPKINGKC